MARGKAALWGLLHKGINPSQENSDLISSQRLKLLILSHWGLGLPHMNLGEVHMVPVMRLLKVILVAAQNGGESCRENLAFFIFMYKILPDVRVRKTILKRSWKDMRKSLLDNGGKVILVINW